LFLNLFFVHSISSITSISITDWFFAGSSKREPCPAGPSSAGWVGAARGLWFRSNRVFYYSIWNSIGNGAATYFGNIGDLLIHFVVSPIDCIFYSFIGLLFSSASFGKSRFALVHSLILRDNRMKSIRVNHLATTLINRNYGRKFSASGDSRETRLLNVVNCFMANCCGLIAWVWTDSVQNFDSIETLGPITLAVLWLGTSAIERPWFVCMIIGIIDSYSKAFSIFKLEFQIIKNSILIYLIISAISFSILKMFSSIVTSTLDTIVYCHGVENQLSKVPMDRKIETILLNYYIGAEPAPEGYRRQRVVVKAPKGHRPGDSVTVEIDGENYDVVIPLGARPGRDFETIVDIPEIEIPGEESMEEMEGIEMLEGPVQVVSQITPPESVQSTPREPINPTPPVVPALRPQATPLEQDLNKLINSRNQ